MGEGGDCGEVGEDEVDEERGELDDLPAEKSVSPDGEGMGGII